MTHADVFVQAILDAPDDDAPRLLYADWLDEHADADRAEFIRVQVALAGRRSPSPGLWRREQELLALHEPEWAASVQGVANAWTFRRGFIEEVRADALALAEGADDLFRQTPVRSLQLAWRLTAPQRRLLPARLAECPHFVRLQALDLSGCCFLHDYGLSAFLASPYLTNLTSLRLNGSLIGDAGVRVLAGWPYLTRLTHLDLSGNGISVAGLRVLAQSLERRATGGDPPRLRSLVLHDNPFGEAGRRVVLASPLLRRAMDPSRPRSALRAPWKK